MFVSSILRRTVSSTARVGTLAPSATSLPHSRIRDLPEKFFEPDRNYGDEIRPVYGRGWKGCELRLKSLDDNIFLKEKNMLMSEPQMVRAKNFCFPVPEHLSKVCGIQQRKYAAGTDKGKEEKEGDIGVGGRSRPLSPHLPVYEPQLNSVFSIYNRISGVVLTTVVAASYLLTTATDYLTLYPFYTILFHSKHLLLISSEMTILALAYHFLHEAPYIYNAVKDRVLILADRPTRLGLRGLVLSKEKTPEK